MRSLIVDDDFVNRQILQRFLSRHGDCDVAVDGREAFAAYPDGTPVVWVQEEPRNQGAWYQIQHHLRVLAGEAQTLGYAGRAPSASPACGNIELHRIQQGSLIETALSADPVEDPGERLEDTDEHDLGW